MPTRPLSPPWLAQVGARSGSTEFAFVVTDSSGARAGAIMCDSWWGGLVIDRLALLPEHRRGGLGGRLLHAALLRGMELGATVACLQTFDYQAATYYGRHGFGVDFVRSGFRDGRRFHYFSRPLRREDATGFTPADAPLPGGYTLAPAPHTAELVSWTREIFKAQAMEAFGDHARSTRWAFVARDATGGIVGSIDGPAFWGGCFIKHLIVAAHLRGTGVGTALVAAALTHARTALGCTVASVETMSFQAPRFWAKAGFTLDHTLGGWRDGAALLFYHLDLAPPPSTAS